MENENHPERAPESVVAKARGSIRGTVKYPWGIVSGAKITIGAKTVISDSAGKYEISDLDSGILDVTVETSFPGYESGVQKVEVTGNETRNLDLHLDFKKAVVEGYVYDLTGKPIPGATLSGLLCGKDVETRTADERGYFRFANVSPGNRFIRANAPGHQGDSRDFSAAENSATPIEFRLAPATCRIHGTVTEVDGKPLQAELLLLKSGVVTQKVSSDKDTGRFEFPLLPGSYQILVAATEHEGKSWYGEISSDMTVEFTLGPIRDTPATTIPRRVR